MWTRCSALALAAVIFCLTGCLIPNGAAGTGGAGGAGGATSAGGAGGAGGADTTCQAAPDCATCRQCAAEGACAVQVQTCLDDSVCAAIDECLVFCGGGTDCWEICRSENYGGVEDYDAARTCLDCVECPTDCEGYTECSS